jgi:predicted phosphodiesterase
MKIAVLSDTHGLLRPEVLPAPPASSWGYDGVCFKD